MKRYFNTALVSLLISLFSLTYSTAFSQNGEPPPPPGEHGQTGNQPPGGGAAIGGGAVILVLLGAGYGAKKWYDYKKRKLAE